jgi:hypothetical protein
MIVNQECQAGRLATSSETVFGVSIVQSKQLDAVEAVNLQRRLEAEGREELERQQADLQQTGVRVDELVKKANPVPIYSPAFGNAFASFENGDCYIKREKVAASTLVWKCVGREAVSVAFVMLPAESENGTIS